MSRHRAVRNLDLDEELAEDDYDQDPYADITEQELADLTTAMSAVQEVLGNPQESGISEREMKDALWDSYFDVDQAVAHLLEERGKKTAKEKKKAHHPESEGEEGADAALPISAMQRLALARRGAQAQAVGAEPARARGLGGLAARGRSGLAKRSLARLAPEGLPQARGGGAASRVTESTGELGEAASLPQKRPAVSSQPGAAPPKISKLAALSAARANATSASPTPGSGPVAVTAKVLAAATPPPSKPLSKLQLRVQAKQAANRAAAAGGSAVVDSTEAMDIDDAGQVEADIAVAPLLLSGAPVESLFPVSGPVSVSTQTALKPPTLLSCQFEADIPGGSPFASFLDPRVPCPGNLAAALSELSPDEIVLNARSSTRLAAGPTQSSMASKLQQKVKTGKGQS